MKVSQSSDYSINVDSITKQYRLYKNNIDRLKALFYKGVPYDIVYALRDITFVVNSGETMGIIGENGAGKSTLLKILAGVLSPSGGNYFVKGRVLSILELGVGFHPEFTGRDNILFYGDMLGMSRSFMNSRMAEIIDFSELEEFIDKPIKTYSSGMIVRLAFSIMSTLDPDIVILDEALAVGDTHFQRKCLDRILEFKNQERTILFCSHDAYQIRMLCDRAMWLREGAIADIGEPERVLYNYESYQMRKEVSLERPVSPYAPVIIKEVSLLNDSEIRTFDDIAFKIVTEARDDNMPYHVMISIKISASIGVCAAGTHLKGLSPIKGSRIITTLFERANLIRGAFYCHARIYDEKGVILFHEKLTPFFEIIKDCDELGLSYMPCKWYIE